MMTETQPLCLVFNFTDSAQADRMAPIIEERLRSHDGLRIRAAPLHPRVTGAEIAAAVLVTVTVIRETRKGVAELRKLIPEIKGVLGELGLASAYADVGSRRIPIADLAAEDLRASRKPRKHVTRRLPAQGNS